MNLATVVSFDEGHVAMRKALEVVRQMEDEYALAKTQALMGFFLYDNGKISDALESITASYSVLKKIAPNDQFLQGVEEILKVEGKL